MQNIYSARDKRASLFLHILNRIYREEIEML